MVRFAGGHGPTRTRWCACVSAAVALLAGCSQGTPSGAGEPSPRTEAPAIERPPAAAIRAQGDAPGVGSSVVIASLDGRRLVFVADADESSVVAVDPDARRELARTPLGG